MNETESYFRAQGVDAADPGRDSFERLAQEFAEACRRGESQSIADYERRYPEHAEKIRKLLPTVALIEQLHRQGARARVAEAAPAPERLGEYRVLREIGRGGMGVVYEAVQESLRRHVALKVIHHVHLDARRLQRFRREAEAVGRLHHTNIVPIFGVGEDGGLPYYVMQLIHGSGLDDLIRAWRDGGLGPDAGRCREVAAIGIQAARALHYAHEQGILHRDVKPPNILVDANQSVWITDFGLAKFVAGPDDLTVSGDVVGTLRYLAPEALRGESDRRGDVYSLGLTLYELLTLNAPFGALDPSELLRHVSEEEPIRPRKLAPAIPRDLETIVLKAIAREPAHRYPTAAALADDLARFLADRPVQARRVTPFEEVWRWARRNRLAATMTATAAAAVLLATAVGWAGYVTTASALRRADANVALSLEVFGELFDRLAAGDSSSTPPLGEAEGHAPPGFGPPGGHGPGPPGRPREQGHDAAGHRLMPKEERHGPPGPMPGGPGGFPGPQRASGAEEDSALLGSVLAFYDRFAQQNATNPRLEGEAAWAYRKVAGIYERLHRDADAAQAYARAIVIFEALVARYPDDLDYLSRLVQTYDMADPRSADGASLARHERWLRRGEVLVRQLVAADPGNDDYARSSIRIRVKLGWTLQRLGRSDEAESLYRETIAFEGDRILQSPAVPPFRIDRATTQESLALIELGRGRRDAARSLLDSAVGDLRFLMDDSDAPPIHSRLRSLSDSFLMLGDADRSAQVSGWADEMQARPRRTPPRRPGDFGGHGPGKGFPPRKGDPREPDTL